MANENLHKAKEDKNDEFYTQYSDIQNEINAYLDYDPDVFRDKVVLLPCDDPEWSNFTKFFAQNFEILGLKKLISTSYAINSKKDKYHLEYERTLFEMCSDEYDEEISDARGKIFILEKDKNNSGKINVDDLEWHYLEGDGDFRSDEVKTLLDEADFVVTNPPFSLFRPFVAWLVEANKKFLIIGSQNAITYKEIFPLLKDNLMWLGNGFSGGNAFFSLPKNTETSYVDGVFDTNTGLVKFRNCCWFTNIDHGRRHQPLSLMTMADNLKFSKHKDVLENGYQKYDNYDAINVSYTDAIPSDYEGYMGVPVTFMDKYCPEQFEIVGLIAGNIKGLAGIPTSTGKDGPYIDGKLKYGRILIRKKVDTK